MRTAVVWPLLLVVTLVDSLSPEILGGWWYDSDILTVRYRKMKIGNHIAPDFLVPLAHGNGQFYCYIPIPTGNSDDFWGKAAEFRERIVGGHSLSSLRLNPQLLCCHQIFMNGYKEKKGKLDQVGEGAVGALAGIGIEMLGLEWLRGYKRDGCDADIIDEWYQNHTRKEYIDKFLDDLCHFNFDEPRSRRGYRNCHLVHEQQEICNTSLQTKSTKKTITTTTARTTTTSSTTTTSTTTTTTSTTTTTTATTSTVETTSSTSTQWWNLITQQSSTQNIVEDDDAEFASGMEDSADNSGQVSSESVVAVLILWLAAFGNN